MVADFLARSVSSGKLGSRLTPVMPLNPIHAVLGHRPTGIINELARTLDWSAKKLCLDTVDEALKRHGATGGEDLLDSLVLSALEIGVSGGRIREVDLSLECLRWRCPSSSKLLTVTAELLTCCRSFV